MSKVTNSATAKALAAWAFRNGPLEDLHAGRSCPTCHGKSQYSHITNAEMKILMKYAVSVLYELLETRDNDPPAFDRQIEAIVRLYCGGWDEPTGFRVA